MAIRSMNTDEEKKKSKATNTNEKKSSPNSDFATKTKKEETVVDSSIIPESFDSSKDDAATEMKKGADMEKKDANVERQEPLNSDNSVTSKDLDNSSLPQPSQPDPSSLPETISSNLNTPSLKERVAAPRGSKQDVLDSDVENNKIRLQDNGEDKDKENKKEGVEKYYSSTSYPKYVAPWLVVTNAWTDLYFKSAKNVAAMAEYWLSIFTKPWPGEYKKKDKV